MTPGSVLGGRYRLEGPLGGDGMVERWAATDQVLARPVTIEALASGADEPVRAAFLEAAAASGRLVHPGIVATYDTGISAEPPFVVTERPGGPTLTELVARQGPLAPRRAVTVGRQLARALAAAHGLGVIHGPITGDYVIVAEDDRAKLGGFAAAGAASRIGDHRPADEQKATDVQALAHTLSGAIHGGPGPADTLRASRPGVPPALEAILSDAEAGRTIQDAAAFASALDTLDLTDDAVPLVERDVTPPMGITVSPPPMRSPGTRTGAVAGVALGLLLAIAVGVAAFVLNSNGSSSGPPTPTTLEPTGRGGDLAIASAISFNPLGTGPENAAELPDLYDGNPSTGWSTETYASQSFGNLKSGDGVAITLNAVHPLQQLTVISPSRGWTFSVYVAHQPAATLAGWGEPIGSPVTVEADVTQVPLNGASGGAVLIWITQLNNSAPFRVNIAELEVR
jgi:serine/threonine protein kinase